MLPSLILVGIDGYLWLSFPRSSIKLGRACILGACLLCLSLLFEGLRAELTIIDRYLPVIEIFVVMILWENSTIILFGPIEAINIGIWIYS